MSVSLTVVSRRLFTAKLFADVNKVPLAQLQWINGSVEGAEDLQQLRGVACHHVWVLGDVPEPVRAKVRAVARDRGIRISYAEPIDEVDVGV